MFGDFELDLKSEIDPKTPFFHELFSQLVAS